MKQLLLTLCCFIALCAAAQVKQPAFNLNVYRLLPSVTESQHAGIDFPQNANSLSIFKLRGFQSDVFSGNEIMFGIMPARVQCRLVYPCFGAPSWDCPDDRDLVFRTILHAGETTTAGCSNQVTSSNLFEFGGHR